MTEPQHDARDKRGRADAPAASSSRSERTGAPNHSAPTLLGLNCPHCDYDLRGLTQPICPECGTMFDAVSLRNRTRAFQVFRPMSAVQFLKRLVVTATAGALPWLLLTTTSVGRIQLPIPRGYGTLFGQFAIATLIICYVVFLIVAIALSTDSAVRLRISAITHHGMTQRRRPLLVVLGLMIFAIQMVLTFAVISLVSSALALF